LLGWQKFTELVQRSPIPVYAIGGLDHEDLATAIANGAHGVALRRAAWNVELQD
jgi:8-oxo-dGTP diphosphatase